MRRNKRKKRDHFLNLVTKKQGSKNKMLEKEGK